MAKRGIGTLFFTAWLLAMVALLPVPAQAQPNHPSEVDAVTSASRIPLEWQPISGEWEIIGPKDLIQTDPGATPALILAKTVNRTCYFLTCDAVKKKRSGAILVAFHYQHEGRWLCWTIGTRESRLSFLEYDQWQKGNTIDSTIIGYASDPEEWIRIKVFVDGLEVKGYINDIPRLNVSLPRGFPSFGYLVLGSWNTPAKFLNIRVAPEEVAALEGKGLFK
jgi:hypothetical protein